MPRRPEARLEVDVLRAIGSHPDVCVYRNETGKGFAGSLRKALDRALRYYPVAHSVAMAELNRHRIAWGLGVGSTDLIGWAAGQAFGLELKSGSGRVSDDQRKWHHAARRGGALVEVIRSPEEAVAAVHKALAMKGRIA